jgi:hypothetical protein
MCDGLSKEAGMSSFRGSLIILMIAVRLSAPALAQPKGDAGSGPTKGAVPTDDAGSGPTKGAKPNSDSTAESDSNGLTENSAALRLALNQLGGSQPATPATPEKKQQALLTNERYLYTLVMNSNAAKAAALPNGQGCRLSLRLII